MAASYEEIIAALRSSLEETEQLRAQNHRLLAASVEPIAIVGISCRYPGGVCSPEGMWELVRSEMNAISEFPTDRGWDLEGVIDPDSVRFGTTYASRGGFVDDAGVFDAEFFGVSPREALAMDPQQRLLLEAAWEALEHAGIDPHMLRGTQTGVFAGVMYQDYGTRLGVIPESVAGYLGTGVSGSVLSGRVAYTFGFEGPAVSVDTACSSSLVALHLACGALRAGECSMALAGGVTVLSTPSAFIEFSRQRGLARDGRCKSFADAADGTAFSEGVGLLLLERLSDAERLGHEVLGLVRGSAVNQDGASNGLTAPNGPSQERVIAQALACAGVSAEEVDAVEGHGTGTVLGDPIEAQALLSTYGVHRTDERPLWLGSVKSNIGHTQAAAGVAGVIKMVMAMRHGVLPATLHVDQPSSHVDWSTGAVSLLTEQQSWEPNGRPRRAGVSSFGISGTNAHVILEEAPAVGIGGGSEVGGVGVEGGVGDVGFVGGVVPWVLSGRGEGALRAQAGRLFEFLGGEGGSGGEVGFDPVDVGFSLAGRSRFESRAVVVGEGREGLVGGLGAVVGGESRRGVVIGSGSGSAGAVAGGGVVFVFPGQGSQWAGMAVELLDGSPVFRERLGECERALSEHVEWSLEEVLRGGEGAPGFDRVDVVQPVLWAVMVSLAGLWEWCGVRPAAVVGHSQGEIAAAVVAGGLSLEDGARVVALRSRLLMGLVGRGGIMSVVLGERELRKRLEEWGGRLVVSAVNGPRSTAVAGDLEGLQELLVELERDDVRARLVPATIATHSPQAEGLREELMAVLEGVAPLSGGVPFLSSVTGGYIDTGELGAEYWYRNLRETVRFEEATRALLGSGERAFVEVSPHPVLSVGVQETIDTLDDPGESLVVGSLRRGEGGTERFLTSLAEVWVAGGSVDWPRMFAGRGGKRVPLPTYAFQRRRYWLTAAGGSGDPVSLGQSAMQHPLLGAAVALAEGDGWLFTGRLSLESHPWLADHSVLGHVLLPGTALLELALHAGGELEVPVVSELVLHTPVVIPERGALQLQVCVGEPEESGGRPVSIHTRLEGSGGEPEGEWVRHATGTLAPQMVGDAVVTASVEQLSGGVWPPVGAQPLDLDGFYDRVADLGLEYGPVFQGLTGAWRDGEDFYAEVSLSEDHEQQASSFVVHPALLDSALHVGLAVFDHNRASSGVRLPFSFSGVEVSGFGASALRVSLSVVGSDRVSLLVADQGSGLVASVESLMVREVSSPSLGSGAVDSALLGVEWSSVEAYVEAPLMGEVGVLGSPDYALAEYLTGAGCAVRTYGDLPSLARSLEEDVVMPRVVVVDLAEVSEVDCVGGALEVLHGTTGGVLGLLRGWLAEERFSDACLVLLSRCAVAARAGETVSGLGQSGIWGLVRSAQTEAPGRFAVVDVDGVEGMAGALAAVLDGEPGVVVRGGAVLVPRVGGVGGGLVVPEGVGGGWRLEADGDGSLEGLGLVSCEVAGEVLGEGQVRVGVRAGGVNFRDVLIALGMYPGAGRVGGEGAGVVLEVGPGVEELGVGDRVMGLLSGLGPVAVSDCRLLAGVPEGWSFAQAASVPVAFLTAYYGLVDLAGLKAGERVLVHAATGGVGMAAVQLARHLGAEVFATASPGKWGVLRSLGLEESHIASSRTVEFRERFLEQSGTGVDVVLDSLAGEFVDASLDLLGPGGRFVEMGKTDIRDVDEVAARYPGVRYRAFDVLEAGPERISEMLRELLELFQVGVLGPLPVRAWDIRRAPEAFRFMSQARHTGKIVLTMPTATESGGLGRVLVTGGTGLLGGLVARHLLACHGARELVLVSRRGLDAPGAGELVADLEGLGASVSVLACDVGDREQLRGVVESAGELDAVVHAAGVLDDGVIDSLTVERLDRVLAAKADAAWYLHELTEGMDLKAFVLFSSAAGVLGSPGQGNYAAANAFLDALAAYRRAGGLAATSIAWGLWEQASEMAGDLSDAARARIARGGLRALGMDEGLELFDAALAGEQPAVLATPIDRGALRDLAREGYLPALLSGLVRVPQRRAGQQAQRGSLARRLAGIPEGERLGVVLELVRGQAAVVLGHSSPSGVALERSFKDLGFDSLGAVELRNRLSTESGLRLPASLVFDYPTPNTLASHLLELLLDGRRGVPRAGVVVRSEEPIAIVGISCRYPGGVCSPEGMWELVASAGDGICQFPSDRGWSDDRLFDPDPDHPGTSYVWKGGFLEDASEFDAEFFGISPREALAMDPQQRLLLEAAWEALEHAGIDPHMLRGTQTGVFAGVIASGYGAGLHGYASNQLDGYGMTGMTSSVASGRVSYVLGLQGPAVSVDTACSSSLVALHLACGALRAGECSMALAGGVTAMATPGAFVEFSRQRGLARDGRCKSFADAADGTAFSEGVGLLLLERLSDAERDGHEVLGLVRGSAVNQDGASNGLTAPNGPSQERVIAQALACAGVSAEEVDAVEGHGTGTVLGDPIEAQALLAAYGQDRARPLWLGSVKSNIGHTQAAAGVAGVIKMVMAMRHGVLPATLHVDQPSSHVDWSTGAVSLLTEQQSWEPNGRPRRAGVSSFGISGTNAHVIIEEAPVVEAGTRSPELDGGGVEGDVGFVGGVVPWVLSGRDEGALRAQAKRLFEYLGEKGGSRGEVGFDPVDVGFSLAGRSRFESRAVVLGEGREVLRDGLGAVVGGESRRGVVIGSAGAVAAGGGVVFVFPGQGSQWAGMAVELLDGSPVFRERLGECERALSEHVEWSVEEVLRSGEGASGLDRVDVVQPVLWAVMVSLAGLWEHCGVRPAAVVGHSQGEIAAAVVAGGLSLEDGARIVALRARALAELAGKGGMVSVALGAEDVLERIAPWGERVSLAAVNGPGSVVVSGDPVALQELLAECEGDGVRARSIPVDYAAHSVQIEAIREVLLEGCAGIEPQAGMVPFYSAVTGGQLDTATLDGEYWYRNLRETVRFEQAMRALLQSGERGFVEVSPHPVLSVGVQETVEATLEEPDVVVVGSLRRDDGSTERFLTSLAEAWVAGVSVDWQRAVTGRNPQRVALPTYAFQRRRYWLTAAGGSGDPVSLGQSAMQHPLLGAAVALAEGDGWLFTGRLSLESHPWLADHSVLGHVLLPGTALLELALHAGGELEVPVVSELVLHTPVVIPERGALQLQVCVGEPEESGGRPVSIHTRPQTTLDADPGFEGEWTQHATGTLAPHAADGATTATDHAAQLIGTSWPPRGAEPLDLDGFYERVVDIGLEYGPTFQGLTAAWRDGENLYAEVSLSEDHEQQASSFGIHPALLDSALHLGVLLADHTAGPDKQGPRIPFSWNGVSVSAVGASRLRVHLRLSENDGSVSLTAINDTGQLVLTADSLIARAIPADQLRRLRGEGGTAGDSLFRVRWVTVPGALDTGPATGQCVVIAKPNSSLTVAAGDSGLSVMTLEDLATLQSKLDGGVTAPKIVFLDPTRTVAAESIGDEDVPGWTLNVVAGVLDTLQQWLADERLQQSRLVVVTEHAVAVDGDEAVDVAGAGVWGLIRSAQIENPQRFLLLDHDGHDASLGLLQTAVAAAGDDPQLAVRQGKLLAPRLARAIAPKRDSDPTEQRSEDELAEVAWDVERTVLITGGTGLLGGLLARHLVAKHGVRTLLLASRQGMDAPQARQLQEDLKGLGARVRIAACDVSDRKALRKLLRKIPKDRPLGAIVHAAGALDDGVIHSLTPERLNRVLAPKLNAAWHLHQLTEHHDLQAFVLISSAAGVLGSPGQANYAAANACLDALATHRHAQCLPATSIAWGLWDSTSELTSSLTQVAHARIQRTGLRPITVEHGLQLFDTALTAEEPSTLAVPLDRAVLRSQAQQGLLPPLLRDLIRVPATRTPNAAVSLARRLAEHPQAEHQSIVLDLVRTEIATVLAHPNPRAIEPHRNYKDLGFDSLTAVELRNRLNAATGLRLSASLVFDHPTPMQTTNHILDQARSDGTQEALVDVHINRLKATLTSIAPEEDERRRITARLQALLAFMDADEASEDRATVKQRLNAASADEVFAFIDRELT